MQRYGPPGIVFRCRVCPAIERRESLLAYIGEGLSRHAGRSRVPATAGSGAAEFRARGFRKASACGQLPPGLAAP